MKLFFGIIFVILWTLIGTCIVPYVENKTFIMFIGGILGVISMAIHMLND